MLYLHRVNSFSWNLLRFLLLFCCFTSLVNAQDDLDCFCQLQGNIDDCNCNVDTVDYFNNVKLYPRIKSILQKDYFRFYEVSLTHNCEFWMDDSRCAMKYCHVESCPEDIIPEGLRYNEVKEVDSETCEYSVHLGFLDTRISEKAKKDIQLWHAYDDSLDNFCAFDDQDERVIYVDLLLNPERYTGYKGTSAHRVWDSIYKKNCFRSINSFNPLQSSQCLEERLFYRVISGVHCSISIHLCANYLLSDIDLTNPKGKWGRNLEEFRKRFSKETTDGQGLFWLKNLYFVYLVELKALKKASFFFKQEQFYTGNQALDWETQQAVKDLLEVVQQFSGHFDESTLFNGNGEVKKLKNEFKLHFRSISKIMNCIGCDKCKLWGKLQIHGLGTALQILFSDKFTSQSKFYLKRTEIVALMNSIGRLSTSIYELDEFRHLLQ